MKIRAGSQEVQLLAFVQDLQVVRQGKHIWLPGSKYPSLQGHNEPTDYLKVVAGSGQDEQVEPSVHSRHSYLHMGQAAVLF